jgi:hypothetical protein
MRGVIKFFKHANVAKALLKELRELHKLGPGLESVGKTWFGSVIWLAISLHRSLLGIRQLCTSKAITIPVSPFQEMKLMTIQSIV